MNSRVVLIFTMAVVKILAEIGHNSEFGVEELSDTGEIPPFLTEEKLPEVIQGSEKGYQMHAGI